MGLIRVLEKNLCRIANPGFKKTVLWIRNGFNADPDPVPAFKVDYDPNPDPDTGSQTNADPCGSGSVRAGAYPGGMHRMHVHPPPGHVHPPPSPAWKAGYGIRGGSVQKKKNSSLFTVEQGKIGHRGWDRTKNIFFFKTSQLLSCLRFWSSKNLYVKPISPPKIT